MDVFIANSIDYSDENSIKWFNYKIEEPRFAESEEASEPFYSREGSKKIELLLDKLNETVKTIISPEVTLKSIDPFYNALPHIESYKYNRDYYSLKTLDKQANIFSENSSVLCLIPSCFHYFKDLNISEVLHVIFQTNKSDMESKYYSYAERNKYPGLYSEGEDLNTILDYKFDESNEFDQGYDVIIIGQTVVEKFDKLFHLSFLNTLDSLRDETSCLIIKFISLGNRYNVDVVYLCKYLFEEIYIVKPASSNPISQEHWLVCKGYISDNYDTDSIVSHLESVLELDNVSSFIDNSLNDVVFAEWLMGIYNDVSKWIYVNTTSFINGLEDKHSGYDTGHPYFLFDHVKYLEQLGYPGRITSQIIPKIIKSDVAEYEIDDPNIRINSQLIARGNLFFYLNLITISREFVNSLSEHISTVYTTGKNDRLQYDLMESAFIKWVSNLIYLGDIHIGIVSEEFIEYGWSMEDIIGISVNLEPEEFIQQAYVAVTMIMQQEKILNGKAQCNMFPNIRYRLSYFDQDRPRILMSEDNRSEILSQLECYNLLTYEEQQQINSTDEISKYMTNPELSLRWFSHSCLPVSFNNLSLPELYFKYNPDIEAFADCINRHSEIWCSPYPSDIDLGSAGNFWNLDIEVENKLMIAFPPQNKYIIQRAVEKCSVMIRRAENFAVIFVVDSDHDSYLNGTFIDINKAYQSSTGKIISVELKGYVLKSRNSNFQI